MLTALLFILLGAVLEGLPAVIILLPTFLPVGKTLGIDLVHDRTVVVAPTGIGLGATVTPHHSNVNHPRQERA